MDLPLDPTRTDASPQELILNLPSQAARRRVLQAAGISMDVDSSDFSEELDERSQIELRRAASQLRFAGARTVYYYRADGLRSVSLDGATGRVGNVSSSGAYGPEVQTAVRDHDRVYVVCDVPETGTQAQLSYSEENRETTVATFEPGTDLLAVRAPDDDTAGATAGTAVNYLGLDDVTRVSFLDGGVRGRFEDACVDGYSTLDLRNTNPEDDTEYVGVRSEAPEGRRAADVRSDAVVEELLKRRDTELDSATGVVSLPTDVRSPGDGEPMRPRVTIGFPRGRVEFEQFVPEQILIEFDRVVRDSI